MLSAQRGIPASGLVVLLSSLSSILVSCSTAIQETGLGGSEALGRYSPTLVQKNGQVKACFDKVGMTPEDLELVPGLQSGIYEKLVERTEGVINPFPPESKILPWCDGGDGFNIRISLLGNIVDRNSAHYAGMNYPNCAGITPVATADNNYSVKLSNDSRLTCAIVFTKVIYEEKYQSKELLEGRIMGLLLHELLHSYALEHEFWHPGMQVAARERGPAMAGCIAKKTTDKSKADEGKRYEMARDFGLPDVDSIMSYCSPSLYAPRSKVKLSDGDVRLLFTLYGNGKSPGQRGEIVPTADQQATMRTDSSTTTQPASECPSWQATEIDFSKGWKASYVLQRNNNAWEVSVTGTSRRDGTTENWETHPVVESNQAGPKFVTYLEKGRRILEHRTPQGKVLTILLVCQ